MGKSGDQWDAGLRKSDDFPESSTSAPSKIIQGILGKALPGKRHPENFPRRGNWRTRDRWSGVRPSVAPVPTAATLRASAHVTRRHLTPVRAQKGTPGWTNTHECGDNPAMMMDK